MILCAKSPILIGVINERLYKPCSSLHKVIVYEINITSADAVSEHFTSTCGIDFHLKCGLLFSRI